MKAKDTTFSCVVLLLILSSNVRNACGVVVDAEGRQKTKGTRFSRLGLGVGGNEEGGEGVNEVKRMRMIDDDDEEGQM